MRKQTITKLNLEIGERIKEVRIAHNLSQEKMATRIGVESVSFYQNIEKGYNNISLEVLINLCKEFDVTTDFILQGKICNSKEFMLYFNTLEPVGKKSILDYIIGTLCGTIDNKIFE